MLGSLTHPARHRRTGTVATLVAASLAAAACDGRRRATDEAGLQHDLTLATSSMSGYPATTAAMQPAVPPVPAADVRRDGTAPVVVQLTDGTYRMAYLPAPAARPRPAEDDDTSDEPVRRPRRRAQHVRESIRTVVVPVAVAVPAAAPAATPAPAPAEPKVKRHTKRDMLLGAAAGAIAGRSAGAAVGGALLGAYIGHKIDVKRQ